MNSWPRLGRVWLLVPAVLVTAWCTEGVLAQGMRLPSSGVSASRPRNVTNRLNRVGFQSGVGLATSRSPTTVARATGNPLAGMSGGYAQGAAYSASAGASFGPSASAGFARRQTGTRSYGGGGLGAAASRRRAPRGLFDIRQLPMSRYLISNEISDLPFSRGAAVLGSQDITVPDAGAAGGVSGVLPAWPSGGEPALTEEMSLGQVLHRRIAWRQELLINKARAEFQEGNYQRAFGQFLLADRIEGAAEKDPKRLVVLSSIAAGNYSRGALELAKLLGEDLALFTDRHYGIDWLYSDPALFREQLEGLRWVCARNDGDREPWLLYAYALWQVGDSKEAMSAARAVMETEPKPAPPLPALTQRLMAGISGRPALSSEEDHPLWQVIGP